MLLEVLTVNHILAMLDFCVVLSKFNGYGSINVDVFSCISSNFYKDASKSIRLP